jgi:hypothetical protein
VTLGASAQGRFGLAKLVTFPFLASSRCCSGVGV